MGVVCCALLVTGCGRTVPSGAGERIGAAGTIYVGRQEGTGTALVAINPSDGVERRIPGLPATLQVAAACDRGEALVVLCLQEALPRLGTVAFVVEDHTARFVAETPSGALLPPLSDYAMQVPGGDSIYLWASESANEEGMATRTIRRVELKTSRTADTELRASGPVFEFGFAAAPDDSASVQWQHPGDFGTVVSTTLVDHARGKKTPLPLDGADYIVRWSPDSRTVALADSFEVHVFRASTAAALAVVPGYTVVGWIDDDTLLYAEAPEVCELRALHVGSQSTPSEVAFKLPYGWVALAMSPYGDEVAALTTEGELYVCSRQERSLLGSGYDAPPVWAILAWARK
jgi:hypothetical protein